MNILITRHDKIGDFITMLPVCKVLKEQSNHKVVMLVAKVNVALAKELDFIDEVIEYTEDSKALVQTIKSYNFSVSISGYIDTSLGKVLFKSRIPKRIAPATKIAQIFFNKRVKQRRSEVKKREFEYNLDLLKAFDNNLTLNFKRPLLNVDSISSNTKPFIIFHTGFGGSSDGNLTLDDYLKLAKKASEHTEVVFSFGPDDDESKAYIKKHLDFKANIRDDFKSLLDFTHFIATSKLFVSTSTGPMHLAGMTNTPTLSFFGANLFASAKRWGTISDEDLQHNFTVEADYGVEVYKEIEEKLMDIINE
ncbi:MAG: ADP-heptose--lipooligosaccharide heptosyltransferase II (EC [uncultured Sulfurovum sp.]|uniref:ADP-heptose--lipooligosaccharide heptosyltransferase II (EC) n=1 Tax=uncultured Sulfurovum sp. TaxID=269237 RepID=A0A6S6SQV0_9BACT|nr:MAG: ADP-heptose--lipooligosaccharide heptosyltransferase II (EC [uncultured Sulfurovum sp.]